MPEPEEYPPGWMLGMGILLAAIFSIGVIVGVGYGVYEAIRAIF